MNTDMSYAVRLLERDDTIPKRLDLNQAGTIELLIEAVPRLGRTFRAGGIVMASLIMIADPRTAGL